MKPRTQAGVFASFLLLGLLLPAGESASALPSGARLRLGTLDLRHTDTVKAVAFPADGRTVVSCGAGRVVLWDRHTGKELRRYPWAQLLAVSPTGKTLAVGWDVIHLIETATGKVLQRLQGHRGAVLCAAFSADGATLVSGGDDRTVRLWQTSTGKEIRRLRDVHRDGIKSVALSANGKTLFSLGGHVDRTVQLWDTTTGEPLRRLGGVEAAIFTRTGDAVIAASGGELILWDTATGKERKRFRGSATHITTLALSPDDRALACGGYDGTIRVYDWAAGKQIQWLPWVRGMVDCFAFSGDGKTLAAGGSGNTVRLWDWRAGKELFDRGHQGVVAALAFSPDGRTLISQSWDDTIRLWDLSSGKEARRWGGHRKDGTRLENIDIMLASPDGKLLILGNEPGYIRVRDLKTGAERPWKNPYAGSSPIAIAPDGKHLLTVNRIARTLRDGLTCTLWDVARGEKVRPFSTSIPKALPQPGIPLVGSIDAIAYAPDSKTFAAAWVCSRQDRMFQTPVARGISLWDVATGKERQLDAPAARLAFLDGGKTLVSAADDGNKGVLQFWDVATLRHLRTLIGPREWGQLLVFAPDGQHFASSGGHRDPTIYLWRTAAGQIIRRYRGHRSEVQCLAFSADGRMLASGSYDTTILVWEVHGGAAMPGGR